MRLLVISFLYWKCPWDLCCTLVGTFIFLVSNVLLQCIKALSFSFITNWCLPLFFSLISRHVIVVMCESLLCMHEFINQSYSCPACFLSFRKNSAIRHLFVCPVLPSDHFCTCFQCFSSSLLLLILSLAFLQWDAFAKLDSITFIRDLQGTHIPPH